MITYLWSLVGFRGLSASAIGLMIATPITLYSVGAIRKDKLRRSMFNAGFIVSQKFKKIPLWDKYIEPAFIKNFATLVIAGNALLEGMTSDNNEENSVVQDMEKMREDIKQDLKEFEEIEKSKDTQKGDQSYTDITNKLSGKIKAFLHLEKKLENDNTSILKIDNTDTSKPAQKSDSKKH
ncbi:unnamed protein product, partial [marine sediment metagenome]